MAESLQGRVGYLLGITPSSTTVPTDTQIIAWLLEGSIYVAKRVPVKELEDKVTVATLDFVNNQSTMPGDYFRFFSAADRTTKAPFKMVSPDYGNYYLSDSNSLLTGDNLFWVSGSQAWSNQDSASIDFYYIPMPSDSGDVPDKLHDLVIQYALGMAKKEAEDMETFTIILSEIDGKIRAMEDK